MARCKCPEMDMRVRALKHLVRYHWKDASPEMDMRVRALKQPLSTTARDCVICPEMDMRVRALKLRAIHFHPHRKVQRWTCVYAR